MQIQERFTVAAPPDVVWRFFEDIERVARCVPGVQRVEPLGADRYRVTATQKVGFMSATFEMTTTIETREEMKSLQLASVGRSVKGALGDLRSRDRVDFEPLPDGGTGVRLTSELAVGGMLGALGHKVIASKSREITEQFARALRDELRRGAEQGIGRSCVWGGRPARIVRRCLTGPLSALYVGPRMNLYVGPRMNPSASRSPWPTDKEAFMSPTLRPPINPVRPPVWCAGPRGCVLPLRRVALRAHSGRGAADRGAIADRSGSERRLLFAFAYLGAGPTAALHFLQGANYLLGGTLYLVAAVTFGAALVFANALLPDIAAPEERDSVSSRGWALGYLGGGVLLGLNLLLVFHAAEPSSPSRYTSWPAPVV